MSSLKIFACGNESRGDDALGPLLIAPLEAAGFDCVQDFQLNIEHALDLVGASIVLFIDASVSAPAPYQFERLLPAEFPHYSTHALPPAAVLAVYEKLQGKKSPPAFVLGVQGVAFALGTGLSDEAKQNAEQAAALLQKLVAQPTEAYWESLVTESSHA